MKSFSCFINIKQLYFVIFDKERAAHSFKKGKAAVILDVDDHLSIIEFKFQRSCGFPRFELVRIAYELTPRSVCRPCKCFCAHDYLLAFWLKA